MIDRYLKEKNVTIHDNINGTYTVTYQDNIDELIKLENEIEILNQALNRLNSKGIRTYNKFSNIRNFLKKVITILSMFLLFRISVVNDLKDFQILIPFISIGVIYTVFHKLNNEKKARQNGLTLQREYLNEELSKKINLKKSLELKTVKTKSVAKEEVILLETIQKKKALLENKLKLLMIYKMQEKSFVKNFNNHTLENVVPNEDDKKFIQEIMYKERRR